MSDEINTVPQQVHPNILSMTFGELLHSNPTAQNLIMQSMHLTPAQFQQLLGSAENSPMMHMTIGEMFKNGTMAQAMQTNPQQGMQVPMQAVVMGKVDPNTGQMMPVETVGAQNVETQNFASLPTPKPSFFQKLKNLFT